MGEITEVEDMSEMKKVGVVEEMGEGAKVNEYYCGVEGRLK